MPVATTHNYAFLLAGLLILFMLIPSLRTLADSEGDSLFMRASVEIGFSLMMLVSIRSLRQKKRIFRLGIFLTGLSLLCSVVAYFQRSRAVEISDALVTLAFCLISGYGAARDVFSDTRLDRNVFYGAVCVYLLTGLAWAILYKLIADVRPLAFNGLGEGGGFDDLLYFSFVTLASLGYGDITPAAPLARTLAYLEVIAGQFYLAIMVAGLVGLYMMKRQSPPA